MDEIEKPNSCEISITSKGVFSGKVKVYAETSDRALELAKDRANDLQTYLKLKNKVEERMKQVMMNLKKKTEEIL